MKAAEEGGGLFPSVRGGSGAGRTFLARWLAERALRRGFPAAEGQISERETPLHRLETVYRRVAESLRTEYLGTGIDVPYPRANTELHARIGAAGAVVSEHPPGTGPLRAFTHY